MKINVKEFENQTNSIENSIKNYEHCLYQIMGCINSLHLYWNDGYTKAFFLKMNKFSQNVSDFTELLYKLTRSFKSVVSYYNGVNNKRKAYFGYSTSLINSNSFINIESDDEEVKNKKAIIRNTISNAENQVASDLSRISVPIIQKLDFESLDKNFIDSDNDFVGMLDNMPSELDKLILKKHDVLQSSLVLRGSLSSIEKKYISNNMKKIMRIINEIEENFNFINNNFDFIISYIKRRKDDYESAFSKMADDAGKI